MNTWPINKWITWTEKGASFAFPDYVSHVGRMKSMPAFDDFNRKQPEPILFGNKTTDSRHFTNFSLQHSTGDKNADDRQRLKNDRQHDECELFHKGGQ